MPIHTHADLTWWRTNGGSFPAWALAARIVFASVDAVVCRPGQARRREAGAAAEAASAHDHEIAACSAETETGGSGAPRLGEVGGRKPATYSRKSGPGVNLPAG